MNPCTLGWYLPLLVKDAPGALQPSDGDRAGELSAPAPGPVGGARPEEVRVPNSSSSSTSREARGHHHSPSGASSAAVHPSTAGRGPAALVSSQSPPAPSSSVTVGLDANARPRRERGQQELVWRELDAKFRRDLPDEAYVGRLAYRGLVMRACPNIAMFDGVEVERKERDKAERLLRSIFGPGKAKDASREVTAS